MLTAEQKRDSLLEKRARIDKELAALNDKKKRPKLPKHLLQAALKQYKELRTETHKINPRGIWLTVTYLWEGNRGIHLGFDDPYVDTWKIHSRKGDGGYNEIAYLLETMLYDVDDEVMIDMIAAHRSFRSYQKKVYDFCEKIKRYEERYDFYAEDLEF